MKFLVQGTVVHIEGVLKEVKEVCGDKKSAFEDKISDSDCYF